MEEVRLVTRFPPEVLCLMRAREEKVGEAEFYSTKEQCGKSCRGMGEGKS